MEIKQYTNQAVDVSNWIRDEEFGEYPEGARDKALLYCPSSISFNFLKPNHRYLFKLSSSRYPDQFWVEILAYLLGTEMNILVPRAFVAYDSKKAQSGALIEWFLRKNMVYTTFERISPPDGEKVVVLIDEIYNPGGDYCQKYIPGFDRKKGKQHNFQTISQIFEDLNKEHPHLDWKNYWAQVFAFDALIGNTDRHQDNWGIIETPRRNKPTEIRISPVFDNGTSMGHEILPNRFEYYNHDESLRKYVLKGFHHMKWTKDDTFGVNHLEMLKKIIVSYPETRSLILASLKKVNYEKFKNILDTLVEFHVPVGLTIERASFMLKLLTFRHAYLLNELEK